MDQMNSAIERISALTLSSQPPASNGKIAWADGAAKKQYFSLPDNIIYYMLKNPSSPEVYLKLGMSCKYSFEKLPLLSDFFLKVGHIHDGGKKFCSNEKEVDCLQMNYECCTNVDLAEITKSNIWLTGVLYLIGTYDPSLALTLIPKLYECKDATIKFYRKEMSMEEFRLWATKFTKFAMSDNSRITATDGSPFMIDSMLEAITNVKEFCYFFYDENPAATSSTMKHVLQLKNLDKLKVFYLLNPPEILVVEDLSAFMKTYKDTKIRLDFWWLKRISDEYRRQLDALVDDIISSEIPYRFISYPGQDKEKRQIMKIRFFN